MTRAIWCPSARPGAEGVPAGPGGPHGGERRRPGGQTIFISHGDCEADAEFVADEVRRRFGVQDIYINYVGPVIGNHSGPGTLALFFLGSRR